MKKNIFEIVIIFIVSLCGGLFGSQILWPQNQSATISGPVIETKEVVIQENKALESCIEKTEQSIVGIKSVKNGKTISGSGLIVTSDGLMVTLSELIPEKGDFTFFINGKTPNWQILKRDVKNNLALVKLDLNDSTTVGFSDYEEIKLGQRIFLNGIIFSNVKPLPIVNEGVIKFFTPEYLRTNMIEKKTLSGSALFDIKGELLGLNTVDDEGKVTTIPVTKIKEFLGY